MARYDVYSGPNGILLLDVQTDLISIVNSRVVIPLLPIAIAPPPIRRLNLIVSVGGRRYVMMTAALAAVSTGELKNAVGSLASEADAITVALDMLFYGV